MEVGVEPGEGAGVVELAGARLAVLGGALLGGEEDDLLLAGERVEELRSGGTDVVALRVGDEGGAGDLLQIGRASCRERVCMSV